MTEVYRKKVRPYTCPKCGNACEPDLLAEVFRELQWSGAGVFAKSFREVMKLRNLEIRIKANDK
jgi:hypothetical protein